MSSDISSLSDGKTREQTVLARSRNVVGAVTPDTTVEEVVHLPEISVKCRKCKNPVAVQFLNAHKNYHNALSMLGYSSKKCPQSTSLLLKRRNDLVQKWKSEVAESVLASSQLQKIDEAYELLKSYLDDTHNESTLGKCKVTLDCRAVGLNCSASCIRSVGICWSENSRWKPAMEDTRVFQDYFGNDSNKCFFAIYDGHNGRFAADLAANDLHHHLLGEMSQFDSLTNCTCAVNLAGVNDLSDYPIERDRPVVRKDSLRHFLHAESINVLQQIMHTCSGQDEALKMEKVTTAKGTKNRDPYAESMSQAFRRAFMMTDHVLSFGVEEQSRVRWSGCSALVCVIRSTGITDSDGDPDENIKAQQDEEGGSTVGEEVLVDLGAIYIANAGNTHAVLSRGGQVHQLSRDHSPANNVEKERLLKAGVAIHAGGSKGKANGILEATRGLGNHGDPVLKSAILYEPYTMSIRIDQYAEFLILATNGLWEVLTNEEAVEIAQQAINMELQNDNSVEGLYRGHHDDCDIVNKSTDHVAVDFDEMKSSQVNIDGSNLLQVPDVQVLSRDMKNGSVDDGDDQDCQDNDTMSQRTDFESMISALVENDDGNEADVDRVTEMHTIYAKSQLSLKSSEEDYVRSIAERASKRLVEAALLAGARDNITVMVILLPGCKI